MSRGNLRPHVAAVHRRARSSASQWRSPEHDSTPFALTVRRGANYLFNKAACWSHEDGGVDVQMDMDDITLALSAHAWSRTGRVCVRTESAPRRASGWCSRWSARARPPVFEQDGSEPLQGAR